MKQALRSLVRELSLVVLPVDAYTGLPLRGQGLDAAVRGHAAAVIIKPEGYCVFCGLPQGEYTISVRSKGFHPHTAVVLTGTDPVVLMMIPDRGYPIKSGMTWLEGEVPPGVTAHIVPADSQGLKLMGQEDDVITVLSTQGIDPGYSLMTAAEPQGFARVGDALGNGRYRLLSALPDGMARGSELRIASPAQTKDDGYLFCPIRGLMSWHREIWLVTEKDTGRHNIKYGCGNSIKRWET